MQLTRLSFGILYAFRRAIHVDDLPSSRALFTLFTLRVAWFME
jgi:hypothetical protein